MYLIFEGMGACKHRKHTLMDVFSVFEDERSDLGLENTENMRNTPIQACFLCLGIWVGCGGDLSKGNKNKKRQWAYLVHLLPPSSLSPLYVASLLWQAGLCLCLLWS